MPSINPLLGPMAIAAVGEAYGLTKFRPDLVSPTLLPLVAVGAFFVNFVLVVLYRVLIYFPFLDPLRDIPQPTKFFPMIQLFNTVLVRPPGAKITEAMDSPTIKNDGLLYYPSAIVKDRLVLTNPKALADVLVTRCYDFEKPAEARDFLVQIIGRGLILLEGDPHKTHRKRIMPSFTFRAIRNLYPIMWRKSLEMTDGIYKETLSTTKDPKVGGLAEINNWSFKATLDIIGVAGLGHDFHTIQAQNDKFGEAYGVLLDPAVEKVAFFILNIVLPSWIVRALPWKLNQELVKVVTTLRTGSNEYVRERKQAVKENPDANFDVLSLMIKGNEFTDEQLVDHILTFLAAGHETTSASLEWLTWLLATHQDVQDKIREEVMQHKEEILRGDDQLGEVLEKLPWLNGACQETLRMYPTVPTTLRIAINDSVVAGHFIPKNTELVLSPWSVNHSTTLWGKDAAEWKPERWIDFGEKPEDAKPNNMGGAENNYCTLTFLHGPRSCIGQGFARAELRCLITAMILRFKWVMAPGEKQIVYPSGAVTIKPVNGVKLLFTPLDPSVFSP